MVKSWSSCAPGKVIIFGEFAVLYGYEALALPLSQQTITKWCYDLSQAPGVVIGAQRYLWEEIEAHATGLHERHQRFLKGELSLSAVRAHRDDLILASLACAPPELRQGLLSLTITSALLEGSGQGSSAALIASLLKGLGLKKALLFEKAQQIEDYQHGRSSGLDTTLALEGKALWYQNGKMRRVNKRLPPLCLIHTGQPQSATSASVVLAQKMLNGLLLKAYPQEAIDKAVATGCAEDWNQAFRQNQAWLQQIGVVPQRVADFIKSLEAQGGAAKISGAGAVEGDGAGMIVAWPHPQLHQIAQHWGYTLIQEGVSWSIAEQLMAQ